MELVSAIRKNNSRCEFHVKINADEFSKSLDKIAKKNLKKISIPGFRKGKAPRKFVEKYYGHDVFFADAINNLLPEAFDFASTESNIEIIRGDDKMSIEEVKASDVQGVEFKSTIDVMPIVSLGKYKDLKINVPKKKVSQEDINDRVVENLKSRARLIKIDDRPSQNSDVVNIDFTGYIDGEAFENGSASGFNLDLGSGQFIEGFEKGVVNHSVSDEFELPLKFPSDYHVPKLAGKEANFKVKINSIFARKTPILDDEFVKESSEFKTVEEYKENIKKQLEKENEHIFKTECDLALEEALVEEVSSEVPEYLVKQRINSMVSEFEQNVKRQNVKMDDYLSFTGLTMESIRENMRPEAEHSVKFMLALKEVQKKEDLKVTDEEVDGEIEKVAKIYNIEVDKIKGLMPRAEIASEILFRKTFDIIVSNSINEAESN